jgi:putative acetyltransferase
VQNADKITIELVSTATGDVRGLIRELDQELAQEYTSEQRHGLTLEAIFQPHVRFFQARLNEEPVGCGGVALFADFAEVKRMFVRSTVRGRGVAKELLTRIETEARNAGLAVLRLETGSRQAAALRLYERAGFRTCKAFGMYAAMPPEAIATSVFMEKLLRPISA